MPWKGDKEIALRRPVFCPQLGGFSASGEKRSRDEKTKRGKDEKTKRRKDEKKKRRKEEKTKKRKDEKTKRRKDKSMKGTHGTRIMAQDEGLDLID